jgi:hypothetical protein
MRAIHDPVFFRPSTLKGVRDPKTQLFPLNASPIEFEGFFKRDLSMPMRDWSVYESRPIVDRPFGAPRYRGQVLVRYAA